MNTAMVGSSPALEKVHTLIGKAAHGTATVLIRGETGTGKELVARAIHDQSPRRSGPFVKVHCAAIPETLLESELFGYEKGAFTGATARKAGRVELSEGGTLFLDEIGDISPTTQIKLLRVLQDREYERLGGTETLKADVRFVAATHRDLEGMVKEGHFREDLFYRLNVIPIRVPALRERAADIVALTLHFAAATCAGNGQPQAEFEPAALAVLASEMWPGNIRQLQALVERLIVLRTGDVITAEQVHMQLGRNPSAVGIDTSKPRSSVGSGEVSAIDLEGAVRRAERRQIEKALHKAKNSRDKAAKLLGISRRTLYYKLQLLGLSSPDDPVAADAQTKRRAGPS
jgi:DNA-binding NtrC family response regulator